MIDVVMWNGYKKEEEAEDVPGTLVSDELCKKEAEQTKELCRSILTDTGNLQFSSPNVHRSNDH